ncbi:unnamed protein product, partial [Rotaria magnacalcarata]
NNTRIQKITKTKCSNRKNTRNPSNNIKITIKSQMFRSSLEMI